LTNLKGLGCRVQGLGFHLVDDDKRRRSAQKQGSGFSMYNLGFMDLEFGYRVQDIRFRVQPSAFSIWCLQLGVESRVQVQV
jgi:hypothetical protein